MTLARRSLLAAAAAAPFAARAQSLPKLKIGVLNDQSGILSADGGYGSAVCAKQAVIDFKPQGFEVEVIVGDHQNKPDVGAAIARRWYDEEGVDVVLDCPVSPIGFAVSTIAREKNKVFITSGGGSTDFTGKQCSPNTLQWTYDTYMLAKVLGEQVVRLGDRSWFFLTPDYVFGHQLQRDTSGFVAEAGGKVVGAATFPFPGTSDFSPYILAAQSSGAQAIGVGTAGSQLLDIVKQASEFGLSPKARLVALIMSIQDVKALGLARAQGLYLTECYYWDFNDRTRALDARLRPAMPDHSPANMIQAGCYSAALHYMKAAAAMGAAQAKADGRAAIARMKAMPTDDDAFGKGVVRADGRVLHPAYVFEIKSPAESHAPWDYYRLVATTPANEAFPPMGRGCALVPS